MPASGFRTCVLLLGPLRLAWADEIQAILHNTIGGKYNRGMTVPDTYRILKGFESLSEKDYKLASVLGWCTELVGSSFNLHLALCLTVSVASSHVPRLRRHHGLFGHSPRSSLLV
jgi:hypothetical protein